MELQIRFTIFLVSQVTILSEMSLSTSLEKKTDININHNYSNKTTAKMFSRVTEICLKEKCQELEHRISKGTSVLEFT